MRSAVIIEEGDSVALVERIRDGQTYYVFPGGTLEDGETVEAAAVREAYEELGVHVQLHSLAAVILFRTEEQYYFHATISSGQFGAGTGEEFASEPASPHGSYRPIWLPRRDFAQYNIRPPALAQRLSAGLLMVGKPALRLYETG